MVVVTFGEGENKMCVVFIFCQSLQHFLEVESGEAAVVATVTGLLQVPSSILARSNASQSSILPLTDWK